MELSPSGDVLSAMPRKGVGKAPEVGRAACRAPGAYRFQSRSRPAMPVEIPGGFSSSSLPPSFLRGRFATFFHPEAAHRGGLRPAPSFRSRRA